MYIATYCYSFAKGKSLQEAYDNLVIESYDCESCFDDIEFYKLSKPIKAKRIIEIIETVSVKEK